MDDAEIIERIGQLVHEDDLHAEGQRRRLTEEELQREQALETSLDQCWDLLRQRRARRDAGLNPDDVRVRDAETVNRYRQ